MELHEINEERIQRLALWHYGKHAGPVQIDVELHKRCNLRCVFCARYPEHTRLNRESVKNEMPVSRWLEIVEECAELDALMFNIEGINEPFAHPKLLLPVMEKVKEVGMFGIITTNGTLISDKIAKFIVEIGWDRLHVSIHSYRQTIHDTLVRRKGAFRRAINAVKLINKWKKKLKTDKPMLNLNMCVNKMNYKDLPRMVNLAHKLKIEYFFTEPLMVYYDDAEKLRLNAKDRRELSKYVEKARLLAEKYSIDNNFGTIDRNLEEEIVKSASRMKPLLLKDVEGLPKGLISAPCLKPWDTISIRYDGKTGHCGFVEHGENAREKSLVDIWYGKFFNKARKMMLKKKLFPHCHKCVPSDLTQRRRFRKQLMEKIKEGKI